VGLNGIYFRCLWMLFALWSLYTVHGSTFTTAVIDVLPASLWASMQDMEFNHNVMNPSVHPTSLGLVGNWQLLVAFLLRLACRPFLPLWPYAGRHTRAHPASPITDDHSLSGTTPGGATPGLPSLSLERPRASSPPRITLDVVLVVGGKVQVWVLVMVLDRV
jgi:hypothetical protein